MAEKIKKDPAKLSLSRKPSTSSPNRIPPKTGSPARLPNLATLQNDAIFEAVKDALLNKKIIKKLADSVVNAIISSPDVITRIVESITERIQEDVTQQVYQSLSVDNDKTRRISDGNNQRNKELENQCRHLSDQLDDLEQYSRRNCLLVHGVPESISENTTNIAFDKLNQHLGTDLSSNSINRSHRLGKPRHDSQPPRPIIVKFTSYQHWQSVNNQKKKLKNTQLLITESLTKQRMELYRAAQQMVSNGNIQAAWTTDGKVIVLSGDRKVTIRKSSDLDQYL